MKERNNADNKSLKRVKVIKTGETIDIESKVKIYAAPITKKVFKKSKKSLNMDKHLYHKRVKSDQIYSVKLLMRWEDKLKNSKHKLVNVIKQPSITRLSTKKNEAIMASGYSQFAFKKGVSLQQSLLQANSVRNTFKSENWTPRKLQSLQKISYEASCLTKANKNISIIESGRRKHVKNASEVNYKNLSKDINCGLGKRTSNISLNASSASHTVTSNDINKQRNSKNLSYRVSNALSPNMKINNIEKNKKNLCDYQKDKRSPPSNSNVVIVMNNKNEKNANLFSKYLKYDQAAQGAQSSRVTKGLKNSPSKLKVIEVSSSSSKETGEKKNIKIISKPHSKETKNWVIPGKEEKLKALQNMPAKKFIIDDHDVPSYRHKYFEEEKKLLLSDEKLPDKANMHIEENPEKQPKSTTELITQYYRVGKVLGKGAFGKVNLAIDRSNGKLVAIKSLNKHYLSDNSSKTKVMQEVAILQRISHKNIVWMRDNFETESHIIFVMELCAGGDLLNYVRKRRKLPENTAKVIFKQVLLGLKYCHENNILHRDIKLDNILLDSKGEVKIGDFGVSKIVKDGEIMTDQWGTPAYIAPEILVDEGYTGFCIDIWSAGVVLYAMLYGTVPFKAHNMKDLHKSIIMAKYSLKDTISEQAMDLIKNILEPDPTLRLSIAQILSHSWFDEINEEIELFNDLEKDKILKEFTYNNTDRYNRNIDNMNISRDEMSNSGTTVESFTEHHLSTQNSLIRNHSTKSVILAPFNSTITEVAEETKQFIREFMIDRKCLKFHARWRDINRQYEMNNNCEQDNGVYNKFMLENNEMS